MLMTCAAIFGVVVPVIVEAITSFTENREAAALARLAGMALVPVAITRIAYRQGYDLGCRDQKARAADSPSG
jgi:lauroyl/myristoyl acyltransferase